MEKERDSTMGITAWKNVDDQNAFTFWEMSKETVIRGTVDLALH